MVHVAREGDSACLISSSHRVSLLFHPPVAGQPSIPSQEQPEPQDDGRDNASFPARRSLEARRRGFRHSDSSSSAVPALGSPTSCSFCGYITSPSSTLLSVSHGAISQQPACLCASKPAHRPQCAAPNLVAMYKSPLLPTPSPAVQSISSLLASVLDSSESSILSSQPQDTRFPTQTLQSPNVRPLRFFRSIHKPSK